jgi:hypothetical protein
MDAKQSATDRNAAARKAQQAEHIASTYRQLWYACRGSVPPGNFYDLPEADKPRWRDESQAAAKALGLIARTT